MNHRFLIGSAVLSLLACEALWGFAQESGPVDRFGVCKLNETIQGGREWFASWEVERTIAPYSIDSFDAELRNGDKLATIKDGVAFIPAGKTRLNVLTPKDDAGAYRLPLWKNVEMTAYAKFGDRVASPTYQAFDLSARSGEFHNDLMPCEGTSYHATARFDGYTGFKKEIWHAPNAIGYTQLRPTSPQRPWETVPREQWVGWKFVCRNVNSDRHVKLVAYLDATESNHWVQVAEVLDSGGWCAQATGCGRAIDEILLVERPTVYFRTDQVDVQVKKLSVREISPLP